MKHALTVLLLTAAVTALIATAQAATPPVGTLPKGPLTTITSQAQGYVSVVLNRGQSGLIWRIARPYNTQIIVLTAKTNLGDLTLWVFRTIKPGTTTLRYALTHNQEPKAYQAATYQLIIQPR